MRDFNEWRWLNEEIGPEYMVYAKQHIPKLVRMALDFEIGRHKELEQKPQEMAAMRQRVAQQFHQLIDKAAGIENAMR